MDPRKPYRPIGENPDPSDTEPLPVVPLHHADEDEPDGSDSAAPDD